MPRPQRGGRAKRMIRVTAKGVQAAKDFYDAVTRVSRGASWVVNRKGDPQDEPRLVVDRGCRASAPHEEREVVLGDLAEAHESPWRGLLDVLGLVTRRQLLPMEELATLAFRVWIGVAEQFSSDGSFRWGEHGVSKPHRSKGLSTNSRSSYVRSFFWPHGPGAAALLWGSFPDRLFGQVSFSASRRACSAWPDFAFRPSRERACFSFCCPRRWELSRVCGELQIRLKAAFALAVSVTAVDGLYVESAAVCGS